MLRMYVCCNLIWALINYNSVLRLSVCCLFPCRGFKLSFVHQQSRPYHSGLNWSALQPRKRAWRARSFAFSGRDFPLHTPNPKTRSLSSSPPPKGLGFASGTHNSLLVLALPERAIPTATRVTATAAPAIQLLALQLLLLLGIPFTPTNFHYLFINHPSPSTINHPSPSPLLAMASSLVRLSPFDSAASSPKRRKFSQPPKAFDSDDDSGDELFSSGAATLPLNSSYFRSIVPASDPIICSSPPPADTQPTQILQNIYDVKPPSARQPPVVQVAASSPFRSMQSSPPRQVQAQILPLKRQASIFREDGSVKPFDFYPSKILGRNMTDDGPQYIGASSDEGSDHDDIKPTFVKSMPNTRPIPSVSFMRDRRDSNGTEVLRIEESPITLPTFKSTFAKFAYGANSNPPIPFKGRLDSITKKVPITYSSGTGSIPGPRPRLQRHPDRAKPLVDIRLEEIQNREHRNTVERMASILPDKSISQLLSALLGKRGSFDDAMEFLTNDDAMVDLTLSADEKSTVTKRGVAQIKTSNRAARAPRKGIKDKWSSTQAQTILSSPPVAPPKTKRRLVRGSTRNSRERSSSPPVPVTISDDSDSEAEATDESDGERELERKVLKYINECTIKELSDIAATTEEIAEVVLSQRPFNSLDEVRGVSSDIIGKVKGKARGIRARAIGDKVVDVCLETWRGYEAVDSLIAKVEELGKPIAESIKKWGVDVFGGCSDNPVGELDMTNIKLDSTPESLKDSAIGTPTDAGSSDIVMADEGDEIIKNKREYLAGQFFKVQPKHLGEGVVLKDYQLVGVNWLSLLYERKLSCILADEMGNSPPQSLIYVARNY